MQHGTPKHVSKKSDVRRTSIQPCLSLSKAQLQVLSNVWIGLRSSNQTEQWIILQMISRQNLRFGEDLHWNSHIAMLDDTGGKPFIRVIVTKLLLKLKI